MADDLGKRVSSLWDRFRSKASDVVAQQSAAIVRGKISARDVYDDAGNLLVGAGKEIGDAVIERATAAGKMPALVSAVAEAGTQDLKEKLQSHYDQTPEGQDRRNLADSDEYLEARRYIKYIAALEVTDIRGNVLVPAGAEITDEDVRSVRDAGQLAALIYSAQQSGPPNLSYDPSDWQRTGGMDTPRESTAGPPSRRTAVPLAETYEEEERD
jgi:hypothetical protein